MKDREVVLMYSGGLDTAYIALQLAEKFSKVHLLTFCNGVCLGLANSKKNVFILQDKLGRDKFEHIIISTAEIFSFLRKDLFKNMIKYRSPLLFDLCCRLAMEVAAVCYCRNKDIDYVSDGCNPLTQKR